MKLTLTPTFVLALSLSASAEIPTLKHTTLSNNNPDTTLTHFAFGACWKPNRSQGHWEQIIKNHPQFWLWLGDNVYANTTNEEEMKKKYQELADQPGYIKLVNNTPVIATWDDHDYGGNDVGQEYPARQMSERVFLDFFNEPTDSPRRQHPGIYTSYSFGKSEKRVQVILLDTRYFRSPLKKRSGKPPYRRMGNWMPDASSEKTMLGETQWQWLEDELKKPARFRIIATSIQFSAPFNGYETWANLPLERQRMINLIKKTKAEGVVFLSGDIHSSEFCLDESNGCYPLFDHTSSSLNVPLGAAATHRRLGPAFGGANFGVVKIDWSPQDNPSAPIITFSTKDRQNTTRIQHTIHHSRLTFSTNNLSPPTQVDDFIGTWQTFYGPMEISKKKDGPWTITSTTRSAKLHLDGTQLIGTWKKEGDQGGGQCTFQLTRDGQFLKGTYSYGDLPQQLDWAGWKMP